ncbi:NAD-dependent epimerase/dehydratase family protein [Candidatus Pacearchaeota archaeon]|nr:NAD-dependent epimerase/dehydratase family protein [Candidatus Pacearchaeota archaeon]
MKVLVTGGAGFIGSHLTDTLIKEGYEVVIVDNMSTGKREYVNPQASFYHEDLNGNLDAVFEKEKPEIVMHLAANVDLRKSLQEPIHDATTNILGTINVLEACRKHKVRKIIYTSTSARVGEPVRLPVAEDHPINPLSPYGISKHTAEHYVWMYHQLYGLDYLIFCFGNVYGPRDDPKTTRVTGLFTDKMLRGEAPKIFGDGTQTRDFIYVLDLAEFLVFCIPKTPEHKLFHLANGTQVSVNELFNLLKKYTGFNGEAIHVPAIKGEVHDIVFDTSLVQRELGWKPRHTYEQGARETVEWFKSRMN